VTIAVRVSDESGASTVDEATVRVIYPFSGFLGPVDDDVVNTVKAGKNVPVTFSLDGDRGLDIFAAGYPASAQHTCDPTAPTDAIESTAGSGGDSLRYDATTDTYTYVFKTSKSWGGTCRVLTLAFDDGTFYTAEFKFLK
jgi:hypothetical protein